MKKLSIERSIWIDAPRERIWQALTNDKQIGLWWPPNEWEIPKLELGAKIKFGQEDPSLATIIVLDSPHRFTLQWEGTEKFPVNSMLTSFVLEAENGGTRLTVTESGFEELDPSIREERLKQTGDGYTLVLGDLKVYVESTKSGLSE